MLSHLIHFTSCKLVIKTYRAMYRLNKSFRMQLHFMSLLLLLLFVQVVVEAVRTYEEAKRLRESLVNSMLKPLPTDGNVRLIGGANEYEGNMR